MLSNYFEKLKIQQSGIDLNLLNSFKTQVDLLPVDLKQEEVKADAGAGARVYVATFLGGLMMGLIYIVIFVYGNMVMRSVMEEKTNRIVEVIISSVKPFDLMMGKIIGVGGVGLTQFAIWGITIPLLNLLVGLIFAPQMQAIQADVQAGTSSSADILRMTQMIQELASFNYFYILGFFVLFFLAGYILYASLFAAVGAAMGDEWGEGQSLTLLISLPVIIAFYVGVAAVENPNSALSFWASLFPLFAPVVMPARLVFDPPIWQLLLSLGLLLASCLFFVWISGRIYRVGILMYGKKVTMKEFVKWIFVKY
jgi:ABC-2 type transport system permease protein